MEAVLRIATDAAANPARFIEGKVSQQRQGVP
jgi:hypothetical protein